MVTFDRTRVASLVLVRPSLNLPLGRDEQQATSTWRRAVAVTTLCKRFWVINVVASWSMCACWVLFVLLAVYTLTGARGLLDTSK